MSGKASSPPGSLALLKVIQVEPADKWIQPGAAGGVEGPGREPALFHLYPSFGKTLCWEQLSRHHRSALGVCCAWLRAAGDHRRDHGGEVPGAQLLLARVVGLGKPTVNAEWLHWDAWGS